MRNALTHAGKTQRRIVSAWIGTASAQDDATSTRKQWRDVADQVRPRVPRLATLMDDAEVDVLAYMGFPVQHRARLHSTNPLERRNGEIKRRSGGRDLPERLSREADRGGHAPDRRPAAGAE